jgi:hypothetical protein
MWQYHEKIWENVEKIRGLTNEFGGYLIFHSGRPFVLCIVLQ